MNAQRSLLTALVVLSCAAVTAQREPRIKPSLKGTLVIPVILEPGIYKEIVMPIAGGEAVVQAPLYKGLGVGVGFSGTWSQFKDQVLVPKIRSGSMERYTLFGKVQYERHTSARTFYELSARFGSSSFNWSCETCPDERIKAFQWSLNAGYYVLASDNLGFGFILGYLSDNTTISPSVFGLETYPRFSDNSPQGPLQHLTFGLGFHARFARSADRDAPF
ncbi:MAG: hypothetical protein JNM31_01090 [Flavobacteriales bacterium]|nr:hypothetical protein [Flavobacteriales bacterium]